VRRTCLLVFYPKSPSVLVSPALTVTHHAANPQCRHLLQNPTSYIKMMRLSTGRELRMNDKSLTDFAGLRRCKAGVLNECVVEQSGPRTMT
jgi:hypothetical protein